MERDLIQDNQGITSTTKAGNVTLATVGEAVVLNCPFKSYPSAQFTWFINKTTSDMGNKFPLKIAATAPLPGASGIQQKDIRRVKGLIVENQK